MSRKRAFPRFANCGVILSAFECPYCRVRCGREWSTTSGKPQKKQTRSADGRPRSMRGIDQARTADRRSGAGRRGNRSGVPRRRAGPAGARARTLPGGATRGPGHLVHRPDAGRAVRGDRPRLHRALPPRASERGAVARSDAVLEALVELRANKPWTPDTARRAVAIAHTPGAARISLIDEIHLQELSGQRGPSRSTAALSPYASLEVYDFIWISRYRATRR